MKPTLPTRRHGPRPWLRWGAGLGVLLCAAAGAAAIMGFNGPPQPAAVPGQVTVHGARGPVGAAQQAQTLAAVRAEGADALLRTQLQVLMQGGEVDLYRGNHARLLVDGPSTFSAMKAAIGKAKRRILLESYIVEHEGIAADIAALLLRKAAEGVQVALIYDAVGSMDTPEAFFGRLNEGGVATCAFNPVNPARRPGIWGLSRRDHRKMLIVDDDIGFTGGINISRVYGSGSASRRKSQGDGALDDGWRDTQIELRGPAVPAMSTLFAQTWREQACAGPLGPAAAPAAIREPGERIVKLLASDPREPNNRIYGALLAAVRASQKSVRLTMAYFAPGQEFVAALADAAQRGVEVELVLPGRSDFALILHAGRSYYAQLLEAGVKLYEMEHAMMHAKTAVIDGVFSTVGSSNLDWRSIVANNEINAIVLGAAFGERLEALFVQDREASVAIDARRWQQRGVRQRALEWAGRAAERWL